MNFRFALLLFGAAAGFSGPIQISAGEDQKNAAQTESATTRILFGAEEVKAAQGPFDWLIANSPKSLAQLSDDTPTHSSETASREPSSRSALDSSNAPSKLFVTPSAAPLTSKPTTTSNTSVSRSGGGNKGGGVSKKGQLPLLEVWIEPTRSGSAVIYWDGDKFPAQSTFQIEMGSFDDPYFRKLDSTRDDRFERSIANEQSVYLKFRVSATHQDYYPSPASEPVGVVSFSAPESEKNWCSERLAAQGSSDPHAKCFFYRSLQGVQPSQPSQPGQPGQPGQPTQQPGSPQESSPPPADPGQGDQTGSSAGGDSSGTPTSSSSSSGGSGGAATSSSGSQQGGSSSSSNTGSPPRPPGGGSIIDDSFSSSSSGRGGGSNF